MLSMLLVVLQLLCCSWNSLSAANDCKPVDPPKSAEFSVTSASAGSNNSLLLNVRCVVSDVAQATDSAAKYAIYGLVFTGVGKTDLYPAVSPLVEDFAKLNAEQKAWLADFFGKGLYQSYVLAVSRNNIRIMRRKKAFVVDVPVSVDKRNLRKALEKANIIKTLGATFDSKP